VMETIRVSVAGATGKLGSMVCSLIQASKEMRLVGAIVSSSGGHVGKEIAPGVFAVGPEGLRSVLQRTDVLVDVTNPTVAPGNLAIATSMGRVLLAGLQDQVLAERLRRADLKPITDGTVYEMEPLKAEIAKVREQGYALVYEELELGLCSIAVPIHNHSRQVAGALNIGFRAREGCREWAVATLLPALREAQSCIEAALAQHLTPGVQ